MTWTGPLQGDLPGQVALREWAEARQAYWANPPRGTCTSCGAEDELLDEDPARCADCRRKTAQRHQAEMFYPCDRCGAEEAFRDPAHRKDIYLCTPCHNAEGYFPAERAMITKVQARVGATHSQGRQDPCIAAGYGTACSGQIKPRGKRGVLCDFHARGGRAK